MIASIAQSSGGSIGILAVTSFDYSNKQGSAASFGEKRADATMALACGLLHGLFQLRRCAFVFSAQDIQILLDVLLEFLDLPIGTVVIRDADSHRVLSDGRSDERTLIGMGSAAAEAAYRSAAAEAVVSESAIVDVSREAAREATVPTAASYRPAGSCSH